MIRSIDRPEKMHNVMAALMETMKSCAAMDEGGGRPSSPGRPHVAVAGMEGLLVNFLPADYRDLHY